MSVVRIAALEGGTTNPKELISTDGRLQTVPYYWNPDTLAYVVATSGGTGVGQEVKVTNTVAVSLASVPLPAGAATAARQDTGNTSLSSVDGKLPALVGGRVPVVLPAGGTGLTDTELRATPVPVSVSGVATSAKQDTGNTSLSSIDGKITAVNTGAVVVSSSALPSGAATAARQDTGNTSVASLDTKTPALGQALAAASTPVVLTAVQVSTLTPPAAITGYALEAGHLAAIDTSTAKIPSQGQALAAASMPVVLTAAQITTLTPVSTVTANAGTNLNTSLLALEAGHLATIDTSTARIPAQGQALAAASLPVVLTAAQLSTLTPPAAITGFSTEATLALVEVALGASDDVAVAGKYDEDATISSRLRTISAQMEEFIDTQKTNQELLFRILMALTSDMPKTALEGN